MAFLANSPEEKEQDSKIRSNMMLRNYNYDCWVFNNFAQTLKLWYLGGGMVTDCGSNRLHFVPNKQVTLHSDQERTPAGRPDPRFIKL
jgi:hypothetical protein